MSIKVHHGAPGSYKTSGAVMDDFVPAVKAGRPIVTNVRGLDDPERIMNILGILPEESTFELIHIDTSSQVGRDKLARFFHWAPFNAFFLIDEAQFIWPKSWKDKDLALLDYPGGIDQAKLDQRPPDFVTAFDMHRHHNWDFVLTTPNINKIRDEIRGAGEMAYRHRNRKAIGLSGSYYEAMHFIDTNALPSNIVVLRKRKVKKYVFKLYKSTATGEHRDSIAGQSIFKDSKLLIFVVFLACLITYLSFREPPNVVKQALSSEESGEIQEMEPKKQNSKVPKKVSINSSKNTFKDSKPKNIKASFPSGQKVVYQAPNKQGNNIPVRAVAPQPRRTIFHPLMNFNIAITGLIEIGSEKRYMFDISDPQDSLSTLPMTYSEIVQSGYTVKGHGLCYVELFYKGHFIKNVVCNSHRHSQEANYQDVFQVDSNEQHVSADQSS